VRLFVSGNGHGKLVVSEPMVCSVSKSFGSVNRRRLNSALKKTVVREPHAGNIAGRSTGKEQYTVSNLNEHFYSSRMPSNILFVFVVD